MSELKNIQDLEKRLWEAADNLRANSGLASHEYSRPVLALIFLRYAEYRFQQAKEKLSASNTSSRRGAVDIKFAIQAEGAMYIPETALFSNLLALPGEKNLGTAINEAMKALELENEALKDTLPKTYTHFNDDILKNLLKVFANVRFDMGTDIFGRIYEYFLNEFAKTEGQGGGEFFTPSSLVRLITEIIEPYHGKVFDPACGSGGMFVSSANFVSAHHQSANEVLSIFGQEKTGDTVKISKMNLAVHGLQGDIREGNSYYEDIHESLGKFDFVMANPPFNVDKIQKDRLKGNKRFPFGMPSTDNGNYIWIQMFYSTLNDKGRAGFVMANSASDARGTELDIRKKLIEADAVDVMIAVSSNFFYTVTLPCALWFFDKAKSPAHKGKVLFIDARHIYRQVTRKLRDYTSEQLDFIANIVRLYRGQAVDHTFLQTHPDSSNQGEWTLEKFFPSQKYADISGLCKVATIAEIEAQGWSLNPGRYVGTTASEEESDEDFAIKLASLQEELEVLNAEAHVLERQIAENVAKVLRGSNE